MCPFGARQWVQRPLPCLLPEGIHGTNCRPTWRASNAVIWRISVPTGLRRSGSGRKASASRAPHFRKDEKSAEYAKNRGRILGQPDGFDPVLQVGHYVDFFRVLPAELEGV